MRRKLAMLERLDRIAARGGPIVVGPWTGEVGYELLYWIPFVRWFATHYRIDPARFRVISRGGPASWYQGMLGTYVDVLSCMPLDEFRQRQGALDWMKQDEVSPFDRRILRCTREALGSVRASILHPLLMFRMFKRFWGDGEAMNDILTYTLHRRLEPPPPVAGLPDAYIAMRFYFRRSFPDSPENRAMIGRLLTSLTEHTHVVLLNPGVQIDDHHDYVAERAHRIHTIDHLLTPNNNLEVQTAVIARARAYVGSYGGFSYLAPLFGVRSVAFYSVPTFKMSHLALAEHVFQQIAGGTVTAVHVSDLDVLTRVWPAMAPPAF
jgi:hypothetical protein